MSVAGGALAADGSRINWADEVGEAWRRGAEVAIGVGRSAWVQDWLPSATQADGAGAWRMAAGVGGRRWVLIRKKW